MKKLSIINYQLSIIVAVSILFCCTHLSFAQTGCSWQQGEMLTYSQEDWGTSSTGAGILLTPNFNSRYPNDLIVGGNYTLTLTNAGAVYTLLPALSGASALTGHVVDPQTTTAGELAGEVVALKLNIDFSDFNLLPNTIPFGDLVINNFSTTPELNGQSIRDFLATAEYILGGGLGAPITLSKANAVAIILNSAFANGTPSQFAQVCLKRGWQQGDFETYTQSNWGDGSLEGGALLFNGNFFSLYSGTGLIVGETNTLTFVQANDITTFLPAGGTAGGLNGSQLNPLSTSAGVFAGEVVALKLNIDFLDAGLIIANHPAAFGDLVINNFSAIPEVSGMTVQEFLNLANHILGGNNAVIGPSTAHSVASLLNGAFVDGTPSQFAKDHLMFVCPEVCEDITEWEQEDFETYLQNDYGDFATEGGALMGAHFSSFYGGGGLTIGGTNFLRFTNANAVVIFLPATGPAGPLTGSLTDPITSSAGELAGQALALQLNVDFSEAGFITGNQPFALGDLVIHDLSAIPQANGMTVQQVLDSILNLLGGSGSYFTPSLAASLAAAINGAFIDGTPSQFAQENLMFVCPETNQCPTAAALNAATAVGTAVKIKLQGTDADGDALTYSISQNPAHGTAVIVGNDSARYTPTAGYSGSDQFTYAVSDGQCSAQATVDITIVICPAQQGYWKNNAAAWPASATPMLLGTVSYSKPQLITLLNTPVGTGNKADASIMLAHKLISVKLSLASGSPTSQALMDSIASANALIGSSVIPMKVKPNTPLGQRMVNLKDFFAGYLSGILTAGCGGARFAEVGEANFFAETDFSLEQNFPNPFSETTVIAYSIPVTQHVTISVYNFIGERVATLSDGMQQAGAHIAVFNAANLPPGIYFCRMQALGYSGMVKMVVAK